MNFLETVFTLEFRNKILEFFKLLIDSKKTKIYSPNLLLHIKFQQKNLTTNPKFNPEIL